MPKQIKTNEEFVSWFKKLCMGYNHKFNQEQCDAFQDFLKDVRSEDLDRAMFDYSCEAEDKGYKPRFPTVADLFRHINRYKAERIETFQMSKADREAEKWADLELRSNTPESIEEARKAMEEINKIFANLDKAAADGVD